MRMAKYEQLFAPVPNVPSRLTDYVQAFEQLDVAPFAINSDVLSQSWAHMWKP